MLRSKGIELNLIQELDKSREQDNNRWILVELTGVIHNECTCKELPFNSNFLLLAVGNILPYIHVITNALISPTSGTPTCFKIQESYVGLQDYTRRFFFSEKPKQFQSCEIKVELDKTNLLLHLKMKDDVIVKDFQKEYDDTYTEKSVLENIVKLTRELFYYIICMSHNTQTQQASIDKESDTKEEKEEEEPRPTIEKPVPKENDVIFVNGRNRKVCKMTNGELGVIFQGKKIALKDLPPN